MGHPNFVDLVWGVLEVPRRLAETAHGMERQLQALERQLHAIERRLNAIQSTIGLIPPALDGATGKMLGERVQVATGLEVAPYRKLRALARAEGLEVSRLAEQLIVDGLHWDSRLAEQLAAAEPDLDGESGEQADADDDS